MNLRVFDDDEQIIDFLTNDDFFKEFVIDDEEHQVVLQNGELTKGTFMPKGVRTLEGMIDLCNKFRKPANVKTNNSSIQYELINLGTQAIRENLRSKMGLLRDVLQKYKIY